MSFEENCKLNFEKLSSEIFSESIATEEIALSLSAENQTYIRFNDSKVRQATDVHQQDLILTLQSNGRKTSIGIQLTSDFDTDLTKLLDALAHARKETHILPNDPHLVEMKSGKPTTTVHGGTIPDTSELINLVAEKTSGTDFTGLYSGGPVVRAMSNSHGQFHWFSTNSAYFDYSLYIKNSEGENKAIKSTYSEKIWHNQNFLSDFQNSKEKLYKLKKSSKKLQPGSYKVFLEPACFGEISSLLDWGALSYKAYKDGRCGFSKLFEKKEKFSSLFNLRENFELGLAPQFTTNGDFAPATLNLIQDGELSHSLVNSRTAKEFGIHHNGANDQESPRSFEILPGTLSDNDVLKSLNTGILIGNLHYLSWSDMNNARFTGMTRFGCFWVESGEIVTSIQDMRFDESFYRIFGENLIELGSQQHVLPTISTYERRDVGGCKAPGALIENFRFTL